MSGMSSYYERLVTSEHCDKPNIMASLHAVLSHSDDIYNLAVYMDGYFDLNTATGVQEDKLGDIVGANRILNFQPSYGISPALDNGIFRNTLKAKIIQNQWDGTINSMVNLWESIFGNQLTVKDNQDMTINVCAVGVTSTILSDMIKNNMIIPHPMGIGVNTSFTQGNEPVFSYGLETDTMKGYNEGYWS